MSIKENAIKHARIKGLILKTLQKEYPNGIDVVVLRFILANLNHPLTDKDLAGYLHYLSDSQYIITKLDDKGDILWVRLANKGLQLMDGWISDPTIIFG